MARLEPNIQTVANTGIGVAVIAFFLFFLTMLLFGFSAYITRTSVGPPDGDPISLDKIIHTVEENERLELEIKDYAARVNNNISAISIAEASIGTVRNSLIVLNTGTTRSVSSTLAELLNTVAPGDTSPLKKTMLTALAEDRKDNSAELLPFAESRAFATNVRSRPPEQDTDAEARKQGILENFDTLLMNYAAQHADYQHEISQLNITLTQLNNRNASEKISLEGLKKRKLAAAGEIPPEGRVLFASLNLMGGVLLAFVKMPTIILTLIVTIAAGGLASLVSFTRKFLHTQESNNIGVSRLLSNVAEGIAASIGIFLFAGTGMLMLTQGSGTAETRVELSPYMVAFLAFISGFMAESAFMRIEEAGRKFFKTEDGGASGKSISDNPEHASPAGKGGTSDKGTEPADPEIGSASAPKIPLTQTAETN